MTSAPRTNLVDLEWIPVRRVDGTEVDVSLREVLLDAHLLTEITSASPLEHEAITRFLTTVTALVVRAAGPTWDPRADTRLPAVAVETALQSVRTHLDLADPTDPFMQDRAVGPVSDFKAGPVTSLSIDRPNGTVQAWHFRGQLGEDPNGQVTWSRLAALLVTFWYFSATSNVDIAGRKQAGALCGNAGNGLHLFWRGPTLAHTLLANTARSWVDSTDLPAWADRDGTGSGASYAEAPTGTTPLWWGSYSPNTVIVWADEATGLPAFAVTGGSPRQPKGVPAPRTRGTKDAQADAMFTERFPDGVGADGRTLDPRAERKAIAAELGAEDANGKELISALAESLRIADPAATKGAAKPEHLRAMSPDLATLRNLSAWYEAGAAEMLAQRVKEVVLRPGLRGGQWALEFCHTTTKNPQVPVYTSAAWVGREPRISAQFTLDPAEARAVVAVASRVEETAKTLCRPLSKGSNLHELASARRELRDHFYYLADAACTQAITDAVDGKAMAQTVLDAVREAALDAFDDVVGPFAGSSMNVAIIQARARVQMDLAYTAATHAPARPQTTITTEGTL